jgi:hypothetical protein
MDWGQVKSNGAANILAVNVEVIATLLDVIALPLLAGE